jgi:AraC-like DNA-binding protein
VFLTNYRALETVGRNLDAPHPRGWPNVVLHARTDEQRFEAHTTSLSVYTVLRGLETHEVGRARFAVSPERYLILNDSSRHAHGVQDGTEVLSVRFRTGLGTDVYTAFAASPEAQLENPSFRLEPIEFFERTYPRDARLSQLLGLLRAFIWVGVTQDALEQAVQPVLEQLLALHRNLETEIERLPAAKRSTREELFRRLNVARDFIESSYLEKLNLNLIADVVNLSPHHFLRLFKDAFQTTPYQFVISKRLEQAREMLRADNSSVTDVCFSLGWESLGSFSRDFKRRFGVPPSKYARDPASRNPTP